MNTNPPIVSRQNSPGFRQVPCVAGGFIFKTRTTTRFLAAAALAALVTALAPLTASAATINWSAAASITADSDALNVGTALFAYSSTATTLNGVAFTSASTTGTNWGSGVSFTSFGSYSANAFGIAAAPFSNLSTAYSNVLSGAAYGGAAAGTVTLNGLTPGHDYSVQIWVNDSRTVGASRSETINGTSVTLTYNSGGLGGTGQYALGYFTADSTNQAFVMTPSASGSVQLNAISVRDNGLPIRTWLGSSSANWGADANWSPTIPPFPSDAVFFNPCPLAILRRRWTQATRLGL